MHADGLPWPERAPMLHGVHQCDLRRNPLDGPRRREVALYELRHAALGLLSNLARKPRGRRPASRGGRRMPRAPPSRRDSAE
eukprot:3999067-Prymnesium_polylepis.1